MKGCDDEREAQYALAEAISIELDKDMNTELVKMAEHILARLDIFGFVVKPNASATQPAASA